MSLSLRYHVINRGLIVPSKEKKKDKRSKLMKKLRSSKSETVVSQSERAPRLVGLLETMRAQMEVLQLFPLFMINFIMLLPSKILCMVKAFTNVLIFTNIVIESMLC